MSEELYQFYKQNQTAEIIDSRTKEICLAALSVIPADLPEVIKKTWKGKDCFQATFKLPTLDFDHSIYSEHVRDFILEMISLKYGRYGWDVRTLFGCTEMMIFFNPSKYQYYKNLLSWIPS